MNPTRSRGLVLAALTACISGVSIYVNTNGVAAYGDPTAYTTAKNATAALVIAVAFMVGRRAVGGASVSFTRPSRPAHWWGLGFVAILGGAVPFVLFFQGLATTASTQASFLHKTLVVWVALLAVPLLKERFSAWHLAAITLLVVGQLGLVGGVALVADPGTMLVGAATLLWAGEVVVSKRLLADVTPWTLSLTRMVGGSVALLVWSAAADSFAAVVPSTAAQWGWVLVTGLLLAGYVLTWHQALWRAPAIDVTAVLVLGALVTALIATILDGALLGAQAPWLAAILTGAALIWGAPRPEVAAISASGGARMT
ncbi:DMT family transporter [Demequina salsinemoris]|uniref:DMT family transporter n=1 Tax=Demequina salsinemoris TaxID=577470 RepID=UPI000782D2A4|nr:DMT family transporter [Demequina salsinemoris]